MQSRWNNMNHMAPLTITISLILCIVIPLRDALLAPEPLIKAITTYGAFIIFCTTTILQGLRWYKKYKQNKRIEQNRQDRASLKE